MQMIDTIKLKIEIKSAWLFPVLVRIKKNKDALQLYLILYGGT